MMSICAIVCKLLGLLGKSPNNFGRQISALVHRAVAIPKQTVDGIRRLSFGLLGLVVWWRAEEKKRQKIVFLLWVPYDLWSKGTPFESWPEDEHLLP